MLDMMGHVSPAMLRRYSHIRAKARREAIAALEGRISGVPTKDPTMVDSEEKALFYFHICGVDFDRSLRLCGNQRDTAQSIQQQDELFRYHGSHGHYRPYNGDGPLAF